MAIYFGNRKVSWNDTFHGGTPTPVPPEPSSPSVSYEEVCKEVEFCKNKLLELGGKGSYSGAWIGLRYSGIDYEDFTLGSSNVRAIRTSDGHFYTYENDGANITHHWDNSKDFDIDVYNSWSWYTANDAYRPRSGRQWIYGEVLVSSDDKNWFMIDKYFNLDLGTSSPYQLAYQNTFSKPVKRELTKNLYYPDSDYDN